jgi:group I intron endonuclease
MKFIENINAPKVGAITPQGVTDKPLTGGVFVFTGMNKICGIYKITSPSRKVYIGQSVDIKRRFREYSTLSCRHQISLFNSFKKYGAQRHKFEILQQCERDKLNELEKYYVDLFQCFNSKYGLNLRDGGGRESKMGPITEEKRRKLRESHKGQTAHNKGKLMSKDQYEKCKNTMFKAGSVGIRKGVKLTQEHKEKLRIAHTGKKLSTEHKQNISNKLKGRPSKLKGAKRSITLREKFQELSKNRQRNKYGQYV